MRDIDMWWIESSFCGWTGAVCLTNSFWLTCCQSVIFVINLLRLSAVKVLSTSVSDKPIVGTHGKISPKCNRLGIWGRPLGAIAPCHTFLEISFSGTTFPCLYVEPFKSNWAWNLTILKKLPQKFNVFGIIADTRKGYRPSCGIHFRKMFFTRNVCLADTMRLCLDRIEVIMLQRWLYLKCRYNSFIWNYGRLSLELPRRAIHSSKALFTPSDVLCLYIEAFRSYLASKLTILERYSKIHHYYAFWGKHRGRYPHILYIFRKLFSRTTFDSQTVCLCLKPLKIIKLQS